MLKAMKIVECIPNFSEGRRPEVIAAIADAARSVPGITVLDCENDQSHNRMVLTFVGEPEAVKQAALASSKVAIEKIDLTKHAGEHPRMGAVDVVPFVPLREVSIQDCVALANEFASEFSRTFQVPVFLYEAAARIPERQDLAYIRKGQFEGLRDLIGEDPGHEPDYGPKKIHPTAGATAVGARPILIAYNVNLDSENVTIAKKIAHKVRGRDGGLSTVKSLGFELKEKKMVQVSMNLTNYNVTSISKAFNAVSEYSKEFGVRVIESEIIGLVPLEAVAEAAVTFLRLANFTPDQIIENRLLKISWEPEQKNKTEDYSKLSVSDFIDAVASINPTPGGGTVSAYSGALAAALVVMVCNLTKDKKGYEAQRERVVQILAEANSLILRLKELGNRDSESFSKVTVALSLPKITDEEKMKRSDALQSALKESTAIPAETARASYRVLALAKELVKIGNKSAKSDAETAATLSEASIRGAWKNVTINLASIKDDSYAEKVKQELESIINEIDGSSMTSRVK